MEKQLKELLKIAALLIEQGHATLENAFLMAIELENRHIEGMLQALSAAKAPQTIELTGYNEVYYGIIEEMAKKTYAKINNSI